MIQDHQLSTTTESEKATSPRALDVAIRAESLARDLAAMATTSGERDLIGRIAVQAIKRTFGMGARL